jgi:glycosyltransferase involved in cell wall biosynthesis
LCETLSSVLGQTYPHLEIVVVDDGSTDRTEQVVAQYAPRVRYVRQANSGPAVARNRGIRATKGEYIAFLDADDIWEPDKVARQVAVLLREPDVGVVFSNYVPFGAEVAYRTGFERSRVLPEIGRRRSGEDAFVLESQSLFLELMRDFFSWTSSLLVRRTAIEQAGAFEEKLRFAGEDWLLCLRLSKFCGFAFVDACLVRRREHPGSLSRQGRDEEQALLVLEDLSAWERLTPSERSAVRNRFAETLFGLAYREVSNAQPEAARHYLRRYLSLAREPASGVDGPRLFRARVYWLLSWLPPKVLATLRACVRVVA